MTRVGNHNHSTSGPCPPDSILQVPGELILALAPRTRGSYWPAQIIQHVPDHKEKYRVKFLDEEEYVITRDTFWMLEEKEFVRCAPGEWESAVKTTDDAESGDEAEDDASAQDSPPTTPNKQVEVAEMTVDGHEQVTFISLLDQIDPNDES